jgi:hypothetical protein
MISLRPAALALLVLAGACIPLAQPARAALVLNEVLYDPMGDDAGAEFVELWNSASTPEPLLGVTLEAGDGARPGSWVVIFAGESRDTVPAGGVFLVDGSRLTGAIQNGPDALRLARSGIVLDRVGWGALVGTEFFEGTPAADGASGESIARRADGVDTDDNAADWAPGRPTPGVANHPPYRVTLGAPRLRPEVAWPGEGVTLSVSVRNDGTRALLAGEWGLSIDLAPHAADSLSSPAWRPSARYVGGLLAPGESLLASVSWVAPAGDRGAYDVRVVASSRADAPGEAWPADAVLGDSAFVTGRVVASPVAVNEFAFRDDGAGEWVELMALEAIPSWEAFSLGDATGVGHRLLVRGGSAGAAARELRVAASDPTRFAAHFALPESLILGTDHGWPTLNDAPASGAPSAPFADVVRVADAAGVPCDAVPYDAAWSARGGSLERLSPDFPSASARSWSESVDPAGGTPGGANSVAAFVGGMSPPPSLLAAPRRVLRRDGIEGAGALVLELGPGVASRSVRLSILDLRGRVRRRLASGERFGGGGALVWDGRDDDGRAVEPGIYVARLEASAAGESSRRASVAIAVAPRKGAPR